MKKEFSIKATMEERWIPHFMSMLKHMEYLGKIGSSRTVSIYSDGDGDFRPKFITDEPFTMVEPKISINGDNLYDAG